MRPKWLPFLILFSSSQLWAQTLTYSDKYSFINACRGLAGQQQSISFNGYSPYWWGMSLTVSNVTFSGHLLLRPQGDPALANAASLNNYDSDSPVRIHFDTGAMAFGADFSSLLSPYNHSNFTATLSLQGGNTFRFSAAPGPGSTFFGFVTSSPFWDLTFSDGGAFGIRQGTDGLPNGTYHEELIGDSYMVVGVPEPRVLPLCLVGLITLLLRQHLYLAHPTRYTARARVDDRRDHWRMNLSSAPNRPAVSSM